MTDAKSRGRVAGSRGRREEGRDIEKKLSGLVRYRIARREEEEAGRREQAKTPFDAAGIQGEARHHHKGRDEGVTGGEETKGEGGR